MNLWRKEVLDQASFDALKETFECFDMPNAASVITRLHTLETQGYTLRPFGIQAYTQQGEWVEIPFGTLDGSRTIWETMQSLVKLLPNMDAPRREIFERGFAQLLEKPTLLLILFFARPVVHPDTSHRFH